MKTNKNFEFRSRMTFRLAQWDDIFNQLTPGRKSTTYYQLVYVCLAQWLNSTFDEKYFNRMRRGFWEETEKM
uniref:Uncharacterized protein n=1 Tax=Romanomermis culicivorax TaxID=13658 RepID=A0A915K7M6_ROMCU